MMYAHLVSYPPPEKNHRENLKVYATLRGNPRTERAGKKGKNLENRSRAYNQGQNFAYWANECNSKLSLNLSAHRA